MLLVFLALWCVLFLGFPWCLGVNGPNFGPKFPMMFPPPTRAVGGYIDAPASAHTQGLVDADYIARNGDMAYRAGQRLVIRETAVRESLTLIEKLAAGMAAEVPAP